MIRHPKLEKDVKSGFVSDLDQLRTLVIFHLAKLPSGAGGATRMVLMAPASKYLEIILKLVAFLHVLISSCFLIVYFFLSLHVLSPSLSLSLFALP